jgi:hypothetical protein
MSKSIYEEALEIIIIHGTALTESSKTNKLKVIKALKQAQKQEKLLELYKKLNNLYEKLYTMELSELSLNSNYYQLEIIKLKQQIKELENDK